jgi:acyl carrier protein
LTENREQLVVAEFEPPQGPLEATIARIQAEVLGVDRVGRGDSFYDFGGTSLQAIRICTRIEQETGRQAQPEWLFEHDTPAAFAAVLASSTPSAGGEGLASGGGRHAGGANQRLGGGEAQLAVADFGEQPGGAEGEGGGNPAAPRVHQRPI